MDKITREKLKERYEYHLKQIAKIEDLLKLDKVKAEKLLERICVLENIDINSIKGATRMQTIVMQRHCLIYLLYTNRYGSLAEVGKIFGNRDHSTVVHAKKNVLKMQDIDDFEYMDTLRTFEKYF